MKKLICFLMMISFFQNVSAHKQHTHQYLTIQAYKLLQRSLVFQYPAMSSHLGAFEGDIGAKPWQIGMITTGAWREDEEDVIYGYKDVVNWDKGAISITHFWDVDNGNFTKNNFELTLVGIYAKIGPYENAYEKMTKYAYPYKSWVLYYDMQYGAHTFTKASGGSITLTTNRIGLKYNTLAELYTTGKATIIGWFRINGEWINCNYEVLLGPGYRDIFVWEILGRMCHLLQDMSVPAHIHRDAHGKTDDGIRIDTYENYFGYNFGWDYYNVYSTVGLFINPYVSSNPLHYLMFITAQMADHFGSNGPYEGDGNDIIGGDYFPEEVTFLNTINIGSLGTPTALTNPLTDQQIYTIRDKMIPQALRATAGLLYWFAVETGLASAPLTPLTSVSLMGDFILYAESEGRWWVTLGNGFEPFTYNWQIMYLDGSGYLQSYESVKKEKEKREKDKKKDGDIIIEAAPSNEWVGVGTNSPYFSKPYNLYDLRDFKLRCTVKDVLNTTKTSNEFYVDVTTDPPPTSSVVSDNEMEQNISLVKGNEFFAQPTNYSLEQNYPNPFNPTTRISYTLPEASFVSLKVYDMLGREIATLVNETKSAGKYEVEFNGSELPSGIYLCVLNTDNYQSTRKMLLIK